MRTCEELGDTACTALHGPCIVHALLLPGEVRRGPTLKHIPSPGGVLNFGRVPPEGSARARVPTGSSHQRGKPASRSPLGSTREKADSRLRAIHTTGREMQGTGFFPLDFDFRRKTNQKQPSKHLWLIQRDAFPSVPSARSAPSARSPAACGSQALPCGRVQASARSFPSWTSPTCLPRSVATVGAGSHSAGTGQRRGQCSSARALPQPRAPSDRLSTSLEGLQN